ncbi:small RNA 2'-O-methyltransferase isoform X2 [Pseudoliparis swirei]|uniref:small RNA 2'-O-methyltransferase isoform X2 n=1 Tax=Pseudoliparis swirei TaxID=2059687 RepID=UPI0024BDD7BC|nr:small RNA 2'-O-methyltransferase isoform X2 [Pseudoliparis swirei]
MDPIFSPPLHRQRHQFVIDFVKRRKPQKVLDLGCSECSLLKLLKFHREIELLVGMDIDGAKLKKRMHGLAPMLTDYLQPSDRQLRIELYQGSVTQRDARLRGFDLVTSIELIEHLTLPDVQRFSDVVFGYMTPGAVIVSTPNCEFNPLFPGNVGFRHHDHKFEWSRAEFESWALGVCLDYGYEVEFTGVGQPPPDQHQSIGFCSQIGVFHRLGGKGNNNNNVLFCEEAEDVLSYTLLYSKNYPSLHDNNILSRVLVMEVLSGADKLRRRWAEEEETGKRETGRWDYGSDPPRNADGEEEEEEEERHLEMEEKQRAMRILVQRQEVEDRKLFWKDGQGQQESCKVNRCVHIPLVVLWSRYPKVRALAGSIGNLRQHLMDHPDVTLSQDGLAVLLNNQEQEEEEEEEEHDDLDDSGYARGSVEPEEDWDADA